MALHMTSISTALATNSGIQFAVEEETGFHIYIFHAL